VLCVGACFDVRSFSVEVVLIVSDCARVCVELVCETVSREVRTSNCAGLSAWVVCARFVDENHCGERR
jgi:hypothetical protein